MLLQCVVVLQCAAVCCSVLQCAAVCCSVLQCLAVSCTCHAFRAKECVFDVVAECRVVAVCCSMLQYVAVCCSVLHLPHVLQGVLLQCVMLWQCVSVRAICCNLLQLVAMCRNMCCTCHTFRDKECVFDTQFCVLKFFQKLRGAHRTECPVCEREKERKNESVCVWWCA